ncbi:nuclear pore complex-interacting protein family member A7-like isoform X7 [Symphalangus syndactylus]|uniref:nuclear pore complex-interacting protein family member A7-like isoform X7 n=1 Tax=Symphalangus syndactylus TaxID=9590 RepID=UPI003007CC69
MEDLYTSRRYMEAKVRAEVHKVTTKVNSHYKINGQRKTPKEEKLFHAAERLRRRAEDYYRRKITPSARKPHANWLCAQALQRKMAERKAASKQQRCEMREKQRVPERHRSQEPVQGGPGLENPFWRDSGPHSVPMRNSSCVPAENREKTKVRMAAVGHHHSSGLPYWPYLTAETLRKRKGHQAPPPTQCHLGGQPPPSAKGHLRPLNLSRLQCRLGPQPHSTTDDFLRRDKLQVECPLGPVSFPPAEDFVSLKTPPECLLVPLPPSPVDDFLTPEKPPVQCCRGPVPSPRAHNVRKRKTPPDSFFVPLPPSPVDNSLSLKTPPECLLVPLPPSPVDDFLTPEKPPVQCCRGPVPSPRAHNVRKRKTPPDSFFVPLPPSPVDNSLSLKIPLECLLVPLPPSPVDDIFTPQPRPIYCRLGPGPSSQSDDFPRVKTPPECFSYLFHLLRLMTL